VVTEELNFNLFGTQENARKQEIRKKIERLNSAHFLNWVEIQSEISPGQFKLLKKLANDNVFSIEDFDYGDDHPETLKLQLVDKYEKIRRTVSILQGKNVDVISQKFNEIIIHIENGQIKRILEKLKKEYELACKNKEKAEKQLQKQLKKQLQNNYKNN